MRERETISFNIPIGTYFSTMEKLQDSAEGLLKTNELSQETELTLKTTGPTITVLTGIRETTQTALFCKSADLELIELSAALTFTWDNILPDLITKTSVSLADHTILCKFNNIPKVNNQCHDYIKLIAQRTSRTFYTSYESFITAIKPFGNDVMNFKFNKTHIFIDGTNQGRCACVGEIPELGRSGIMETAMDNDFYTSLGKLVYNRLTNLEFEMYRIMDTLIELSASSIQDPTKKINNIDFKDLKTKIRMFLPTFLEKCTNDVLISIKPKGILTTFESIVIHSDDEAFYKQIINTLDDSSKATFMRLEATKAYIIIQNWYQSTTRRIKDLQTSEGAPPSITYQRWPILWKSNIKLRDLECFCESIMSKPCSEAVLLKLYLAFSRDKLAARTDLVFALNLNIKNSKEHITGESGLMERSKIKPINTETLERALLMKKDQNAFSNEIPRGGYLNDEPLEDNINLDIEENVNNMNIERTLRETEMPLPENILPSNLLKSVRVNDDLWNTITEPSPPPMEYGDIPQSDEPKKEENINLIIDANPVVEYKKPEYNTESSVKYPPSSTDTTSTSVDTNPDTTTSTSTTTSIISNTLENTSTFTYTSVNTNPPTTTSTSTTTATSSNTLGSTSTITYTTSTPVPIYTSTRDLTNTNTNSIASSTVSNILPRQTHTSRSTYINTPTTKRPTKTTTRKPSTPTTAHTPIMPAQSSTTNKYVYDIIDNNDGNNDIFSLTNNGDIINPRHLTRIKRNFVSSWLSSMTGLAEEDDMIQTKQFENTLLEREKSLEQALGKLNSRDSDLTTQLKKMSTELQNSLKTESSINDKIADILSQQITGEQEVNKLIQILDKSIKKCNKVTAILAELQFLEQTIEKFKKWINNVLHDQVDIFDVDARDLMHHFGSSSIQSLKFTSAEVKWDNDNFKLFYYLRRLSQPFNIFNLKTMVMGVDKNNIDSGLKLNIDNSIAIASTGEYIWGADFKSKCVQRGTSTFCDNKDVLVHINGTDCELDLINLWLTKEDKEYKSCYDDIIVRPTPNQDYIIKEGQVIIMSKSEDTGRFTCTGGQRETAHTFKIEKGLTRVQNQNKCGITTTFLSIPGGYETHITMTEALLDDLDLDAAMIQLNDYMGTKMRTPFNIKNIMEKLNSTEGDLLNEHTSLTHLQATIEKIEALKEIPNLNLDFLKPLQLDGHKSLTKLISIVVMTILLIMLITCCCSCYHGSMSFCCAPFKCLWSCCKYVGDASTYLSEKRKNRKNNIKLKKRLNNPDTSTMLDQTQVTMLDNMSVAYTPIVRRVNPDWKIQLVDNEYFLTASIGDKLYKYDPTTNCSFAGRERNDIINNPSRGLIRDLEIIKRINKEKMMNTDPSVQEPLYPSPDQF